MGIGASKLIKLVALSEQQGVDGAEPLSEEIANVWAEVIMVTQRKGYADNKSAYNTSYEFYLHFDSSLPLDMPIQIEYNNQNFIIQAKERGSKIRNKNKREFGWFGNPDGMYWRLIAQSENI